MDSDLCRAILGSQAKECGLILTHPHEDHFGGIGILRQWFPDAPIYIDAEGLDPYRKSAAAHQPPFPEVEVLPSSRLLVDGQQLEIIRAQGDESRAVNSSVWVPSLRALVAGDTVFSGVHVWLATSTPESRLNWLQALHRLAGLKPQIVIAGHRFEENDTDLGSIAFTAQYIQDFQTTLAQSKSSDEISAKMKSKYSALGLEDKILGNSVKAQSGK